MDAFWMAAVQGRRVRVLANRHGRAGIDHRALAAIGLCAALPVLIGIILTAGTRGSDPPTPQPAAGHWVYVSSEDVAVHVDGAAKRADATVDVGSAVSGSPVLQDRKNAYLVGDDRMIMFGPDGVTGDAPTAGLAEDPVPLEAPGAAYLVYRTAGLIVQLGPEPVTVAAEGPLGAPVITPDGRLWTYQVDSGKLCVLTEQSTLDCSGRVPSGHTGGLAVLDGDPGFVDVTDGTWQALDPPDDAVELGMSLPANAAVGPTSVGGRLAIVDPTEHSLLLIDPGGDGMTVPLGDGDFGAPVSTGDAVAVVDTGTGTITTYDAGGQRRDETTGPGGAVQLTIGADGRAYADSTDGLRSMVMDGDGTLTTVRTTEGPMPSYEKPAPPPAVSLPPATIEVTTTETIPPVPETVTVPAPTTTTPPSTTGDPRRPPGSDPPASTESPSTPAPPAPERPSVDVLSAEATGPRQARIRVRVSGPGPVFCHVYFNSVERAATKCSGTMNIDVSGLAAGTLYDVYVLGTNTTGTGPPGRRAQLRT